jgi:hypothetical protein
MYPASNEEHSIGAKIVMLLMTGQDAKPGISWNFYLEAAMISCRKILCILPFNLFFHFSQEFLIL